LLLLTVDEALLSSPWRDDEVSLGVFFPHVYGPIDLDAIVAVTPLVETADGAYQLP
jgi:glutathione S-transferase